MHHKEVLRQGYLTHGRFDGPIPPKKRKEFEMWQNKLKSRAENAKQLAGGLAPPTLSDSGSFCEKSWRAMGRGASESDRAYEYRTGVKVNRDGKRKRQATPTPEVSSSSRGAQKPSGRSARSARGAECRASAQAYA